ncbi:MAG TPA: hypothetical protein VGG05_19985 [Pseudonocardiaceae bacterium]
MTPDQPVSPERQRPTRARLWRTLLVLLVVPLVVYFVARPFVGDDATALGYTAGAELVIALVRSRSRRRWPIWSILLTASAVVWFGGALALTILTHGNPLPFKLERPIYSGIVGLVLLASVAIGRPIGSSFVQRHQNRPLVIDSPGQPRRRPPGTRMISVVVGGVGLLFVVEALVTIGWAFALPTAAFVVVSRVFDLLFALFATIAPMVFAVGFLFRQARRADPCSAGLPAHNTPDSSSDNSSSDDPR